MGKKNKHQPATKPEYCSSMSASSRRKPEVRHKNSLVHRGNNSRFNNKGNQIYKIAALNIEELILKTG